MLFSYQVFPFLETQTVPGGSKFNAKKGSILLDNLHSGLTLLAAHHSLTLWPLALYRVIRVSHSLRFSALVIKISSPKFFSGEDYLTIMRFRQGGENLTLTEILTILLPLCSGGGLSLAFSGFLPLTRGNNRPKDKGWFWIIDLGYLYNDSKE